MRNKTSVESKINNHFEGIALRPVLKNTVECFELCCQFAAISLHLHCSIIAERTGCE